MKRCRWLVVGVFALSLAAAPPALAQPGAGEGDKKPKRKPKPAKEPAATKGSPIRGYYAIMASVCKLTDEQKTQFEEKIKARSEALKAWDDGADGQKVAELKKKLSDIPREKREERGELAKQLKPLEAGRAKIEKETRDAILAILTPEQRVLWDGQQLYTQRMRGLGRAKLTDEQKEKVRELCQQTAKAISELPEKERRGKVKELEKQLSAKIDQEVLTAEQREAMKAKPSTKPKNPDKGKSKQPGTDVDGTK